MKKCITLCLTLVLALALAATASASGKADLSVIGGADGPTGIFVTSAPTAAEDRETSTGNGVVEMQINGEYIDFTGAEPEIVGGRTMVPMRGVLDALGATVDYDHPSKTVTAALGGVSLRHTIGTEEITVSGGQVLTMDGASYVKNGSVMVPVRFFSQALGLEVYWDRGQRTAVVIDKQKLISQIDSGFAVLNGFQEKQAAGRGENLAMTMDLDGTAKVLDSIGGDKEYPFSMEMTGLYGPSAINAQGSMDLSILTALMEAMDEEVPQEMAGLLKDFDFQMICSSAGLWMQMPAVMDMLRASGEAVPQGEVWFQLDGSGAGDMMDLYGIALAAQREAVTMGGMLYAMAEYSDLEVPVNIYDDVTQAAALLTALVGDGAFARDGGDYVWTLDQAAMDTLAEALGAASAAFPGTMEMTLHADGSSAFSLDLTVDEAPLALTMTMSGTSTATDSAFQGRVQVKNVCDVTFQATAAVQASQTAPFPAPPADAVIVDMGAAPLVMSPAA